jgi:hypothetical protein
MLQVSRQQIRICRCRYLSKALNDIFCGIGLQHVQRQPQGIDAAVIMSKQTTDHANWYHSIKKWWTIVSQRLLEHIDGHQSQLLRGGLSNSKVSCNPDVVTKQGQASAMMEACAVMTA